MIWRAGKTEQSMQVAFHLGADATDTEALVAALAANRDLMAENGIFIPDPGLFRPALRQILDALDGGHATIEQQEHLLALCSDGRPEQVRRLILTQGYFIGMPDWQITPRGLYPVAADRLGPLASLFPAASCSFYLALVNPALLIGALHARQYPRRSYEEITGGLDPEDLRWGPVLRRMQRALGPYSLTVWCNEDLPLIQPAVLRSLAGIEKGPRLAQALSVIGELLTAEGKTALDALCGAGPADPDPADLTEILLRHGAPEAARVSLPLPGWTQARVERISALYDADSEEIAALPGLTFLHP